MCSWKFLACKQHNFVSVFRFQNDQNMSQKTRPLMIMLMPFADFKALLKLTVIVLVLL